MYAAERAAFEGTSLETVVDLASLRRSADQLTASPWWPRGPIPVRAARSDAGSSSARVGPAGVEVRLAAPQQTVATLAHELAHVLAGVEHGHDAVFRRAHVDVVGALVGDEPAQWLAEAYEAFGLVVGARSWTQPPPRAIAL
ncbi:MAG: hypothetical protein MUE78_00030 [Ilumatobacteraceae bacterium]|nr:hypothetical protein [Ilumatobacteraceae bacterium]